MRFSRFLLILLSAFVGAWAQSEARAASASVRESWDEGAADCDGRLASHIQVRAYDAATFILRQPLCTTFEAPFLYLLLGTERALLLDTGAVADRASSPVGEAVRSVLEARGEDVELLVLHTHGHRDHRDGDAQFDRDTVVSSDLDSVRAYFGFEHWPEGEASVELGGRNVLVVPAPGHHSAHLAFYDEQTGLLFTGDHLLPGRLIINDLEAFRDTTRRLVELSLRMDVALILGSHIELDQAGRSFWPGATHHPNERVLPLQPDALYRLSDALGNFNGVYEHHGDFVLVSQRNLLLTVLGVLVAVPVVLALTGRYAWRSRT